MPWHPRFWKISYRYLRQPEGAEYAHQIIHTDTPGFLDQPTALNKRKAKAGKPQILGIVSLIQHNPYVHKKAQKMYTHAVNSLLVGTIILQEIEVVAKLSRTKIIALNNKRKEERKYDN